MKILVIGNGGREHAIAWKFAQDPRVKTIFVSAGNAGSAQLPKTQNVVLNNQEEILHFAQKEAIDLTFIGAEQYLVEGIVDNFKAHGLKIFGADKKAAMLEGSKQFAKDFMQKYGVKTADYANFFDKESALSYLKNASFPLVIKADGLAAGKGVVICQNFDEAQTAVQEMMCDNRFGSAGKQIVIEQFLHGFEVSILSFCDGKTILPLKTAKDHKTIGEYNQGENTGGMGVVAPHPQMSKAQYQAFLDDILTPTLNGIQAEGLEFAGVIFFGLMVNESGVYLLEYNMRLGDPETQAVLPLMESELLDPVLAAIDGRLQEVTPKWSDHHAVCVVAASGGYPRAFNTDYPIHHLKEAQAIAPIFIAGAKEVDSVIKTSGGRVLNVVGIAKTLDEARALAYQAIETIDFTDKVFRKDIGEY